MQSWHTCVGAPPDAGFEPIFRSVAGVAGVAGVAVCRSAARRGLRPVFSDAGVLLNIRKSRKSSATRKEWRARSCTSDVRFNVSPAGNWRSGQFVPTSFACSVHSEPD